MGSSEDRGDGTDVDAEPLDTTAVEIQESRPPPPPLPVRNRGGRSIPPPIPDRRKRPTTIGAAGPPPIPTSAGDALETPTALERALTAAAATTPATRAQRLSAAIEAAAANDPRSAAILAYELGEVYEQQLADDDRAIAAYRRAAQLDPAFAPAAWGLRRMLGQRRRWPELLSVIERELARADDGERAELLVEKARVLSLRGGGDAEARTALDAAIALAPAHQGALLELERVLARLGDPAAMFDVQLRLAEAAHQPERKVAYWVEAAQLVTPAAVERMLAALDDAARVAAVAQLPAWAGERIARERLRIVEAHGSPAQLGEAMDALAAALNASAAEDPAKRRELVALRRRQATHVRSSMPINAWDYLQQAREHAPDEPVLLVELIELASELGRYRELEDLVHDAVADEGPAALVAFWIAEAHLTPARRAELRALLRAFEPQAPGTLLLMSAVECEALADPTREEARLELANAYLAGAEASSSTDPAAATSLYVQAAELLAYYARGTSHVSQARGALARALELAPEHPAVLEAWIELADMAGDADEALARLKALAIASHGDRGVVERALRVARKHGRIDAVLELERDLVTLVPDDVALAWRLEAALAESGKDAERAELLAKIAKIDPDPARKQTALLWAARLNERAGADEAATDLFRQLLALTPRDTYVRDALIGLLRTQQRWPELAAARRAEARELEPSAARRAWREAAWVLEVLIGDVAQAAEVYGEWWAKLPDDRTAMEGAARCRATLRDHAGEVAARAAIDQADQTTEARWLYARSLERAGRLAEAAEQYRRVIEAEDAPVAATSAALALAAIATRSNDLGMRIEAAEALAQRSTDARFAAALLDDCGWLLALALDDDERAAAAFQAALAQQRDQTSSLFGAVVVAARRGDDERLAVAYEELAEAADEPALAIALGLRAAMAAIAGADPSLAFERIEAVRQAAPDDAYAIIVAAETARGSSAGSDDPFGADEVRIARSELFARRGALCDDPVAAASWELDRADLLEGADQLREAGAVIAGVLERNPEDRRALAALRRIARQGGDLVRWAQASFALARRSRDPETVAQLLRDAAEVYDAPDSRHAAYACGIYRRIVAADPGAPEFERLLALLRERGDAQELVDVLTARLRWLTSTEAPASEQMVPLLLERASSLKALSRNNEAAVDLDALLDFSSSHAEALRLRADLAVAAGDVDRAVALWWRYLAVEPLHARRAEVEVMLEKALASDEGVAPPPPAIALEIEADDPDYTDVASVRTETSRGISAPRPETRRAPAIIRRAPSQVTPAPVMQEVEDDFSENTMRADLSALQEAERREAQMFESNTALTDLSELQEAERREATKSTTISAQAAMTFDDATATKQRSTSTKRGPAIIRRQTTGSVPIVRLGSTPTPSAPIPIPARAPHKPGVEPTDAQPSVEDFFDLGDFDAPSATAPPMEESAAPRRAAQIEIPAVEVTSTSGIQAVISAGEGTASRTMRALTPPVIDVASHDHEDDEEPVVDAEALVISEERPGGGDDSAVVMLSYQELQPLLAGDATLETLRYCQRELAAGGEPAVIAVLEVIAGRITEGLGQGDKARAHYQAALAADPRSRTALASLRRIARSEGDLAELARLVDTELAFATGTERDALARYRLDVLLARGDHAAAAAVIDELLARSPSDVGAWMVRLELALRARRSEDADAVLAVLASVLVDADLRGAIETARTVRAERAGTPLPPHDDAGDADASPRRRITAIRQAIVDGQLEAVGLALLELAYHVEGEDPTTAAALAVRAQVWIHDGGATEAGRAAIAEAAQLAARIAARDPLVARIATESALVANDTQIAVHAFARWVRGKSNPVERAYAAARAAELEPARFGRMWAQVLELDPGDDHASDKLRTAHLAAGELKAAVELDLQRARDTGRDAPVLAAVDELLAVSHVDEALAALTQAREERPSSIPIAEALAEVYARLERWTERARLLGEIASEPGPLASEIMRRRGAQAYDRAVHAVRAGAASRDELELVGMAALDAWDLVRESDPTSPLAHASAINIASLLADRELLIEALSRAQEAERSPWAAASLALRRARLLLDNDPRLALEVARDAAKGLDDPRRTLGVMMAAAHRRELGDAAAALEERAAQLEASASTSGEPGKLRVRAAQVALDAGDAARASRLLSRIDATWPSVGELADVARRRTGAPPAKTTSFLRALRDADTAAARNDPAALALYQRALELRPGEALAAAPLVRLALELRQPTAIAKLALERVRLAQSETAAARADAHELVAQLELLRGDAARAQAACELAAQADPTRVDLLHRVERALAAGGRYRELLAVRERQIALVRSWLQAGVEHDRAVDGAGDLATMLLDAATLALHDKRSDAELTKLYAAVVEAAPRHLPALLQLEALARRGPAAALAELQARLVGLVEDPRVRAALLVRIGEALAAAGRRGEAITELARAIEIDAGYAPAAAQWLHHALLGEQWQEVARAAAKEGRHHLAGVVLMDKVAAPGPAIAALRLALDAEPSHRDGFVRLRQLFERTGRRDELAALLHERLGVERDPRAQVELQRSLAEHAADAGDRKTALQHYRHILTVDPADVRAHAAIADLVTEPTTWEEAAAAVSARLPIERDPRILRSLHYRLGMIYRDHDVAQALAAFQKAASYRPDDEQVLQQITDLAIRTGDWKLALEACEHLVTTERDPEKLAFNLQRAAMIFAQGFNDLERTERMLTLALEAAPTNPESLRSVVQFYRDAGNAPGLRLQLQRLSGVMRAQLAQDPLDGAAYRTLSRASAARGEPAGLPIARAAAELAHVLGAAGEPEHQLLAAPPDLPRLPPRVEAFVLAGLIQPELQQLLASLAEPIAKHVGVDLESYGVSRKQRLRANEPVALIAREVAAALGIPDIDVYVSATRHLAMVAEPTSPPSLVLGAQIAAGDPRDVRFAAAAALTLARTGLAIPARLPPDELGALVHTVLRLTHTDRTSPDVDHPTAERLRRHIPAGLLDEVRSIARRVELVEPGVLAQSLTLAGLRAGWVVSGTVLPGLAILAGAVGTNIQAILPHPIARELISFALADADTMAKGRVGGSN